MIIFWAFALDWAGFHSRFIARLLKPPPLPLINEGAFQWRNMRREYVTEEELRSHLRLQGIDHVGEVRLASMEPDGQISVLPYERAK